MKIVPIRSTSLGIQGTYRNIKCHAQNLLPMVQFLERKLKVNKKLKLWKQGHNIHEIVAEDGRRFVFKPVWKRGEGYVGISLAIRVSRGSDIPLFNLFYDMRNGVSWQLPVDFLRAVAKRKEFSSYQLATKDA